MGREIAFLNTTARDLNGEIVLPDTITFRSSELEVLVTSMEGIVPPGETGLFPLNLKLWLIPDYSGLFTSVDYQALDSYLLSTALGSIY